MNRSGPNTEPCGTPQDEEKDDDLRPETETMDQRDEKYDRKSIAVRKAFLNFGSVSRQKPRFSVRFGFPKTTAVRDGSVRFFVTFCTTKTVSKP